MSDGTLKMFSYLLLLNDPEPAPFICIEEPENGLYHKLLETLAREFREHATGKKGASQIFITTHQPYFVDALDPEEVWILEKGKTVFPPYTGRVAVPDQEPVAEGLPLGGLWYSDYLDARYRMHFEILVEDQSGKKALDILVPKMIGNEHTFNVHPYKGIGRIPKNLGKKADASKRILLDQLPSFSVVTATLSPIIQTIILQPSSWSGILMTSASKPSVKSFSIS